MKFGTRIPLCSRSMGKIEKVEILVAKWLIWTILVLRICNMLIWAAQKNDFIILVFSKQLLHFLLNLKQFNPLMPCGHICDLFSAKKIFFNLLCDLRNLNFCRFSGISSFIYNGKMMITDINFYNGER